MSDVWLMVYFPAFATLTSLKRGFFEGSAKDLTALCILRIRFLVRCRSRKSFIFIFVTSTFICDAIEKFKGLKCKQEQEIRAIVEAF